MGEWERKAKAKAHTQSTDDASGNTGVAVAGNPSSELFVRCVKTSTDIQISINAELRLIDRRRERIEVYLAARSVGEVCDEHSRILREQYSIADRPGSSASGRCTSVDEGLEFMVRVEL